MKKARLSIISNFWSNMFNFFSYSHSERVVIKTLNSSLNSITRQVTIDTLRKFHCKNPDLLSSFVLGIVKTFESAEDKSYSKLPGLAMSKIRCNYEVLQVDSEAKRAGEIYAECVLDNVTSASSIATKYIVTRITEV